MQQKERQQAIGAGSRQIRLPRFHQMRTDWLARAALLPGRSLHYAMAVHLLANIADSSTVTVGPMVLARFGISRDTAGDALTRLVGAGLVRADRGRGRAPVVTLLDSGGGVMMRKQFCG